MFRLGAHDPEVDAFGKRLLNGVDRDCLRVAGLAILSGILDVLATRLIALLLSVFSALVLAPMIFAFLRDHVAWGGNAYNLAAVGAAWIVADWLATCEQPVQQRHPMISTQSTMFLSPNCSL